MTVRNLFALLGAIFATLAAHGDERLTYVCTTQHSVGYAIRDGEWQPTQFNVKGHIFMLTNEAGKWRWRSYDDSDDESVNRSTEAIFGKRECGTMNHLGFLSCTHYGQIVRFNQQSLRFQVVETHGYVLSRSGVADEPKNVNTPFFQIGTCV